MKTAWTAMAAALVVAAAPLGAQPQWPAVTDEAKAGARWWWMGSAVSEAGLEHNISQYAQAGLGTLEITPIYGVKGGAKQNIAFLSPEWLGKLRFAKEQAAARGMAIDMATGTGWPFGGQMVKADESASRLVTEEHRLSGDGTTAHTVRLTTTGATLQRVVAYPQGADDAAPFDLTAAVSDRQLTWTAPAGDWRLIAAYCQTGVMQVKRPSPGSEGLVVDYFDSTAVAHYLQHFDTRFLAADGAVWPRSFFNDSYEITQADWTRHMFDEFLKYRGYRLEDCMDKLVDMDPQVTADYRQTLADMLLHNFTEQWTAWAHSHGATTRNQAHGSPGNLIDLYAAADIPETESFYMTDFGISGLRTDPGFTLTALSTMPTLKYASSAAHITGKRLTSSESMTWLTEHFRTSLSQMKPELDQLFLSGVNHVLFHGTTYSPPEAAWPGWKFYAAIDFSPTNTLWRDAPELLSYIARTQSFLQMGQPDNDVLVYAPFAAAMHKTTGAFANRLLLFDINNMDARMAELASCTSHLQAAGLDCDYTSERYLMTTRYADGYLTTAAGTRYKALVVPVSDHLPDSVRQHLDRLAADGARIVYAGGADAVAALALGGEQLRTQLGLQFIRRRNATGYHYFVANLTPTDAAGYVSLAVPAAAVAVFDPLTGSVADAATDADGRVYVSLKSGQSLILQTYDTATTTGTTSRPLYEIGSMTIGGQWHLSFADDAYPATTGRTYELDGPQPWQTLDDLTAQLAGTGIYLTTFNVTAPQLQAASGGFRLRLGDVRESARVWVNDHYVGCAWSVPFTLDCPEGVIREGSNTLRIEVTNLPANRISQMDRDGTVWRIFEDTNINTISASTTYAGWTPVPSGLNSPVSLVMLAADDGAATATLSSMEPTADGDYQPVYEVATADGSHIAAIAATDTDGHDQGEAIATAIAADGRATVSVGAATTDATLILTVTDDAGRSRHVCLPAYGTYRPDVDIDFTATAEPLGGWQLLASTSTIKGFEATGSLPWYRTRKSGKELTLYDGVTFRAGRANYYFYFPGYGMNTTGDFQAVIPAHEGDVARLSYLVGTGTTLYQATDSLTRFASAAPGDSLITMAMPGNASYTVYRSLTVFRPATAATAVRPVRTLPAAGEDAYYTLQGQRTLHPQQGLYIRKGKKVAVR